MTLPEGIDLTSRPSGPGCVDCDAVGGWWVHLRRCAECGHVGCCDTSPAQHATGHFGTTGHPYVQSYKPGEDWYWDYRAGEMLVGPRLPDPQHHPLDQTVPGPADRVPPDWQNYIH